MILGSNYISTGFKHLPGGGWFHVLLGWRSVWRLAFVAPHNRLGYRRLYFGPLEIEASGFWPERAGE